MEYNAYYTTRQPVPNRSNSISVPYSRASTQSHSPHSNRNSSTASQDSGYSSSMSNRKVNGERGRSGSPGHGRSGNGNSNGNGSGSGNGHVSPIWANTQDWEKYRDIITSLYRDESLHLKKVQFIMSQEYGFSASERMYKTRISKWGLDKNLKAHDVMVIYRLNQNRAMVGKRSVFTVRGRPMDYQRVEQYIRRDPSIVTRLNNEDLTDLPPDHARTAGITCRTPSPSPPSSPSRRSTSQSHSHPMGHTQTMMYNGYTGYAQPQQQNTPNGHRHSHPDQHYSQQRHSFGTSSVLPSQATMPLSVPQMPLPLVTSTSAMTGFGGVPATAGPSSYGASLYNPMNINGTSPTVSPFHHMATTAGPSSSAYQLSGPAAPATTMAMMPTNVNTPRTVNAEPRGYSFAPMPGFPQQGHPSQGHLMTGHQQHQAAHTTHTAHTANNSRVNGHHSAGLNGNAVMPENYNWPMNFDDAPSYR